MHHAERHFLVASDAITGSYYDTLEGRGDLFVRARSLYDGAIPSGNSLMVHNWITLFELTDNCAHLDRAARDLRAVAATMQPNGASMIHMHHALLRALMLQPDLLEAAPGQSAAAPATQAVTRGEAIRVAIKPAIIMFSNQPATFTIELTIDHGHHINSPTPTLDHLVPTQLTLADHAPFKLDVQYPPTTQARYAHADEPLHVYEGTVTLTATLTCTAATPPDTLRLLLRYQPCTDRACLRPQQLELPIHFAR
jgi:hypothetical protein